MPRKPLTLEEARAAFRLVKEARSARGIKVKTTGFSDATIERYLGHFGYGPRLVRTKNLSGAKKKAATAAKKAR